MVCYETDTYTGHCPQSCFGRTSSFHRLSPETGENVKTTKVGQLDGVHLYSQTQTTHIVHHLILVKET